MKTTLCSAIVMLAVAAPAAANAARDEVTRTLERTVAVTGNQTFVLIHSSSGNTRIRTHARREIRIVAAIRVSAESRDIANEFMQSIDFDVATLPAQVRVETRHAEMGRRYRNLGFAIDLDVLMPDRMPLEASQRFGSLTASGLGADSTLKNTNGRLSVTDVNGRLRLENRFGPIETSRVTGALTIVSSNGAVSADTIGGSLDAVNRFGPVTLRGIAQSARVENSNGAITVDDVRGGAVLTTRFGPVEARLVRGGLRVDNSNGNISAFDVDGETNLHTAFGLIIASRVRGSVVANNSNGAIRIAGMAGPLNASTNFGAISLRDVDGPIDVRSANGNVDVALTPKSASCHRVALDTRFGGITVYVAGGGYDLSAVTRFGRIQSDVPVLATGIIQPQGRESTLNGTIGGGGCPMQIVGSNGDITLRSGAAPPVSIDPPAPRAPRQPRR